MKKCFLILVYILFLSSGYVCSREMLDYEKLAQLPVSELFRYGDEHRKLNHTDTAMGYYIILAGKYDKGMDKMDKYLCAMACNVAGQIFHDKANYSRSFELYMKGVRIAEENDFGDLLPRLYINIGNVYGVFEDYEQAINCYKKALDYALQCGDEVMEMRLLVNLAGACCYENRTEEAKDYYGKMMKFADKDTLIAYYGHLNKALILRNEMKYDSAVACFRNAAEYAACMKLPPLYTGSVYGELAKLYEQIGLRDSAIYYFHLNTAYTEEHSLMYMLIESLKGLARLYEQEGDAARSLHYKSRYLDMSDSLFGMDKFNKIKNAQFIYEIDKNYRKIASLTAEQEYKEMQIKTQRRFLVIISSGLMIFIILLVIVYAQKRKLHLAYKDLFSRNSEILQSDLQNKELKAEYENKLAEERARYEELERQTKTFQATVEPAVGKEEEKKEEVKLYSANKLTNEQKENLLRDINKIMENTDEFCDSDFSLEHLADLIGSNSRYVSQIINETYNKNFRTFVNEYRIKEARLRLMNIDRYGNYTIKAIGESVGYKSHTNFIDIFKKITGITPSIYQKMAKTGK